LKQAKSTIFPSVLDSLPELIWVTDIDGKFIWFNRPWLEFTGATLDKQVGEGYLGLVHEDDREQFKTALERTISDRMKIEYEFRLKHFCDYDVCLNSRTLFIGSEEEITFTSAENVIKAMHILNQSDEEINMINTECRQAGIGCVDCKKIFAKNLNEHLMPFRERRVKLAQQPDDVWGVLNDGGNRARAIAKQTISEVKEAIGLP